MLFQREAGSIYESSSQWLPLIYLPYVTASLPASRRHGAFRPPSDAPASSSGGGDAAGWLANPITHSPLVKTSCLRRRPEPEPQRTETASGHGLRHLRRRLVTSRRNARQWLRHRCFHDFITGTVRKKRRNRGRWQWLTTSCTVPYLVDVKSQQTQVLCIPRVAASLGGGSNTRGTWLRWEERAVSYWRLRLGQALQVERTRSDRSAYTHCRPWAEPEEK